MNREITILAVGLWVLIIGCFGLAKSAFAWTPETRDVCFTWQPNTEPNLAGYKIHHGVASGEYDSVVDAQLPALDDQGRVKFCHTYQNTDMYFAATAYDSDNFESDYSSEVFVEQSQVDINPPAEFQKESVTVNVTVNFN
jgi:hypothetical protein